MGYNENLAALDRFLALKTEGLPIPATEENIKTAAAFALDKWRERRREYNKLFREKKPLPTDLSGACKFCSMFAVKLFGGELQGNEDHQWVELDEEIIDLTDNVDDGEYDHDDSFWLNEDHVDALVSNISRVNQWVDEFSRCAVK